MNPELIDRLRGDLRAADYRAETVRALLGDAADDARLRGVFAPARRALDAREAAPLGTLVRLLLLGEVIGEQGIDEALPSLRAASALELQLITASGTARGAEAGCRAALSLNPVRVADDSRLAAPLDWWILSDLDDQLRNGPAHPDHVMGVGGATRSLIAQLPPHDAGRALDLGSADSPRSLDLGTGCGIVAMHLALRGPVVATDISERALDLARANARLNGMEHGIEFRHGDLFAPVTGSASTSSPPIRRSSSRRAGRRASPTTRSTPTATAGGRATSSPRPWCARRPRTSRPAESSSASPTGRLPGAVTAWSGCATGSPPHPMRHRARRSTPG
ncbi:DUF7059 domain-containing protein [Leucobacter soli]|uniref:DUF7059 domain-containing protein n=1 Tax=Leucobacter soli TaxID=2812850 RepID=UPI0036231340